MQVKQIGAAATECIISPKTISEFCLDIRIWQRSNTTTQLDLLHCTLLYGTCWK